MTPDEYIKELMAERGLLFDACKEYRQQLDEKNAEIKKLRSILVTLQAALIHPNEGLN